MFIESAISKNQPKTSNPLLPSFVSLCIQQAFRGSSHGLEVHWEKSSHIELKHPVIFNWPGVAKQIMTHSTLQYTAHYNTQHITIHSTLQYTTHYNTQHITIHSTLKYTTRYIHNTLQYTAQYNTQCITILNSLQYTRYYNAQHITTNNI